MKTLLREIIHQRNKPLQTIEDNDLSAKERQKYHADKKHSNLDHKIQGGDTVLVRQQKQNKLTPPYNPAPYIVTYVRESMVTAAKGGHSITRNSSFFKTVPTQDSLSQLAYPEAESRHRSHSYPDELDTPVELTQDDPPPKQTAPQLHPSGTQSEPCTHLVHRWTRPCLSTLHRPRKLRQTHNHTL
ncbi:transposon ty3-g Gag-Pol polyprotein [Plakobranchus ocellatus]|uniref:Transposon ty3-g Gag-Pol polyprotein n=1 Tax=Plakobranchus ocellatus TaxID=259542 RepID=A0AAV3YFS4_9GAST|nr:transposon ty3-g Gag-Pol polyprotein [Plakobranchus ocellatus]